MRLVVETAHLDRFKRAAKARWPREYVEMLCGTIHDDVVRITDFVPIDHRGSEDACFWTDKKQNAVKMAAVRRGLCLLGTIHSHPELVDASASEFDHIWSSDQRFRAIGICSIYETKRGLRARVQWWRPQLPLSVEYRKGDS